ncbi:MAG: undecaprenyl-phosphate glucose phosphotransferase [Chloroflexota bacterium]|nr:MAG: undecaprenyl-phosphate glucose phosphotransferase [Chloroflexota bacterium]
MTRKIDLIFGLILLCSDVVAAALSVYLAYRLRFRTGLLPPAVEFHQWSVYWGIVALEAVLVPVVFFAAGLYRPKRSNSRMDEVYGVFTSFSITSVATMAISAFISGDFNYSRALLGLSWLVGVALIVVFRWTLHFARAFARSHGLGGVNVLLVGSGDMARFIIQNIRQSPGLGYRPIGIVSRQVPDARRIEGVPVLGDVEMVGDLIQKYRIGELIIAEPDLSRGEILEIVARCEKSQVSIRVFPDVFQIMTSGVGISDLNGLPMVSVRDLALRGWNLTIKRGMDLVVSCVMMVLLSPLLLLLALLVKVTSPGGSVFYVQERVGLDGKPFPCMKFRTMRPNAEAATGPVWASQSDPRRTPLGGFMRRYSLDELPQFINVLLGEMSVVGPRPERQFFVEKFSQIVPRYQERHKEKAGITGWAQIHGLRGNSSIEERTAFDLWYVENWTPWLDIRIMLGTLIAALRGDNAY